MAFERRRLQSVSSGYFEYDTDILCLNLTGASSIVNHENIHVFQHAGTPYGHLLQSLLDIQILAIDEYMLKCKEVFADHKVPVPAITLHEQLRAQCLLPLRSRSDLGSTDIRQSLLPITTRWEDARMLEEILEARDLKCFKQTEAASSIQKIVVQLEDLHNQRAVKNSFVDRSKYLNLGGHLQSFEIPDSSIIIDSKSLCPCGKFGDQLVPIGGLAVMEGMALLSERSIFEKNAIEELASLCLDPTKRIYTCTFQLAYEKFLESFDLGKEGVFGRPDWKDLLNSVYSTFLPLSELALFTPVGYIYGCLRTADNSWTDIHPGHRFVKAISCLQASDWIEAMDPDQCKLLQNRICSRLGWSIPDQFLQIGSSLNIDKNSPRYLVRHQCACSERLQHSTYYYVHLPSGFYSRKDVRLLTERYLAGIMTSSESRKFQDYMNIYSGQLPHKRFMDEYGPAFFSLHPTCRLLLRHEEGLFRFFRLALAESVATLGVPRIRDLFPRGLDLEGLEGFTTYEDLYEAFAGQCPWHPCLYSHFDWEDPGRPSPFNA